MKLEEQEKIIREDWFKDHTIKNWTGDSGNSLETLEWGRLGTSNYCVFYVRQYSTLMVWGDLGEAIYQWSYDENFDLKWIAGCDLSYFAGKCQASENGRKYNEWDEYKAAKVIRDHFQGDCAGYKKYAESYLPNAIHNKEEFHGELYQLDLYDMFRDDCYWVFDAGDQISIRCQSHLIGLKMALLENETASTVASAFSQLTANR